MKQLNNDVILRNCNNFGEFLFCLSCSQKYAFDYYRLNKQNIKNNSIEYRENSLTCTCWLNKKSITAYFKYDNNYTINN